MRAATLRRFGEPLVLADVPDPVLGSGEVVVDVVAAGVLPYASEVFSGARRYPLALPAIPGLGAIGRVREVGPDATRLATGDWVHCDATVRSRDGGVAPDIALQGWSARGDGGLRLARYFHDGAYAERIRVPTENAVPIGPIVAADASVATTRSTAAAWTVLDALLVPYGGWLAGCLAPGETVLVNGATGGFGAAAVVVALAMGASAVVATGRNRAVLDDLARRLGPRVRTVAMHGAEEDDRRRIHEAAAGPVDCVLDLLPPAASATQVRTALLAVRPYGRVVLMGGVGMLGGGELALPYPWIMRNCVTIRGQWMYPVGSAARLAALIRGGLVDLSSFDVTTFALDDANEAVVHAAEHAGAFAKTVIVP